MDGITVIICCHNSSVKIPYTLMHLGKQKNTAGIPWEIVLVDNASTDNTAEIARKTWTDPNIELRIIFEPRPGLSYARMAGIEHSRYEFLNFIDDDNWVSENWINTIHRIMSTHPEVAMCGGQGEAVFETKPPHWFNDFQEAFAVGPQSARAGYLEYPKLYLYGAGSILRKSAWISLQASGFEYLLTGRKGKSLSSGEDTELCFALILAGYKIWYDPDLKFKHYMPSERLSWTYLIRLFCSFGKSDVILSIYSSHMQHEKSWKRYINRYYVSSFIYSLYQLTKKIPGYIIAKIKSSEGDKEILYFNRSLFALYEMTKYFGTYNLSVHKIKRIQKLNMHNYKKNNGK